MEAENSTASNGNKESQAAETGTNGPEIEKRERPDQFLASNIMKEKSPVVLYLEHQNTQSKILEPNAKYHNKFGSYSGSNLIGKQFGTRVSSDDSKSFLHCLKQDPVLFTCSQERRTQILYPMDISFIVMKLDLKPGDKVIESGTGSGSLSFSLSWNLGKRGHLFTYEFNSERAKEVECEFAAQQLKNITVTCRNVCSDGFCIPGLVDETLKVDAVFLDLPNPWEAIPHAHKLLNAGKKICTFSPCIEQVAKSVLVFEKLGYLSIATYEVLLRDLSRYRLVKRGLRVEELIKKKGDGEEETKEKVLKFSEILVTTNSGGMHEGRGHTGYLTFAIKPAQ